MRDHPNALMLFAAGFGTRMGALTAHQPKPLIKVAGKALIDHTLDLAKAVQPNPIVANLHYHTNQLQDHLAPLGVQAIVEQPDILETGGGLRNALPALGDGPVYTSNTDAIWKGPNPFEILKAAWKPEIMDALLLCVPCENTVGHPGKGDFILGPDGSLTRGPGVVYGGIQILKTDGLAHIKDTAFSLNLLWNEINAAGRLFGVIYSGKWCDVGTPEGITLAENMLESSSV
ncbi:nucleotidyltransferase family protein [Cognatishimia sp. 1_MG-2023]|uniref:nucleotidyltransferase family protein n=1 Tax=Cognatishimia sp. 1_MG-2023 TaxID=3062642 RepID=UPI0026E3A6D6|nr:nucleotidyltransferase family protein [Cognatishimia sp. 1_MG-2023]MDO6727116.1 nucleotidyltransferase family protein [Cognatishimia sp. 1_MG-2023]